MPTPLLSFSRLLNIPYFCPNEPSHNFFPAFVLMVLIVPYILFFPNDPSHTFFLISYSCPNDPYHTLSLISYLSPKTELFDFNSPPIHIWPGRGGGGAAHLCPFMPIAYAHRKKLGGNGNKWAPFWDEKFTLSSSIFGCLTKSLSDTSTLSQPPPFSVIFLSLA